ncbi:hypothetical protein AVEN_240954-1, partial [Araneus ventricosus]
SITETERISKNSFSNEKDWKKKTAKINQMKGKAYMGFRSADPKTTQRIVQDVPREERKMDPAGNSRQCQESKKRGCDTVSEQERQRLFDEF